MKTLTQPEAQINQATETILVAIKARHLGDCQSLEELGERWNYDELLGFTPEGGRKHWEAEDRKEVYERLNNSLAGLPASRETHYAKVVRTEVQRLGDPRSAATRTEDWTYIRGAGTAEEAFRAQLGRLVADLPMETFETIEIENTVMGLSIRMTETIWTRVPTVDVDGEAFIRSTTIKFLED